MNKKRKKVFLFNKNKTKLKKNIMMQFNKYRLKITIKNKINMMIVSKQKTLLN